jgi:hypothetical protein
MTQQDVIDQQGNVVEVHEFASWADLCQPPQPKEVKLSNGKYIKYLPWITTDRMAEIQRQCSRPGKAGMDFQKFITLLLETVMIQPPVHNEADRRALLKAGSNVTTAIMNDVVDTDTFNKLKEDLGEG